MGKIKLRYKTSVMKNPATKQAYTDKRGVHIVDVRNYTLDELAKFALENNYIEGCKPELAKGILKGAIEAERALLLAGNAVTIDGWVKYEPRLKGSVDAEKKTLSEKTNSLIIGISALKELKLPLSTFAWECVDEKPAPAPEPEPEPEPTPAPDPIWESGDGLVKVMSVSDAETGSTFTWGDVWSMLGEGFTGTEPGWFVEIAMLSAAPGAEPVSLDFDVKSATEVELTPGAGAELEAGDYPNATITFGIAHDSDEGLVTETAEIPVHLVVNA